MEREVPHFCVRAAYGADEFPPVWLSKGTRRTHPAAATREDEAMTEITPCLWFDTEGEAAANFYTSVFPNSKILDVARYGSARPRLEGTQPA